MATFTNPSRQQLLVIDQAPLYDEAMSSCQLAFRSIDQLRVEIQQHETLDQPAYERWFHSAFGAYLTEIRQLSSNLREKEATLASARKHHWARFFGASGGSPTETAMEMGTGATASAYAYYEPEEGMSEFEPGEEEDGVYGPAHEEYLDEDDVVTEDDTWSRYSEEDAESVHRFENLFVRGSPWKNAQSSRRSRGPAEERSKDGAGEKRAHPPGSAGFSSASGNLDDHDTPAGPAETLETRLKDRYRLLVKRLHPDLNAELTPESKKLWIQVQSAYREKDLEKLDLLIALSEAFSGRVTETTSLHQLRRASLEIRRHIAPLQKKLDEAKQSRAWKFTALKDRAPLQAVVEREFKNERSELRSQLNQVEALIERFTRKSQAPAASNSRSSVHP